MYEIKMLSKETVQAGTIIFLKNRYEVRIILD